MNQLEHLAQNLRVAPLIAQATQAVNAVHRSRINLRRSDVTSSEAIVRGARLNCFLSPHMSEHVAMSAYSVLAPGVVAESVQTFVRAPLQVLARIDALAGGDAKPVREGQRLILLARMITMHSDHVLVPALVHGEIASREFFGERSGTVARVAMRLSAMAGGFDPRGLCVPEVYYHRNSKEYVRLVNQLGASDMTEQALVPFLEHHFKAYIAGAAEGEGIAQTMSTI
ncbi:hypothetical protein [Corynebacterium sp. sy039]|uniref:hypothetical protein n=1 Tax=Corynebacterium sp. sy039 TaxID=2599641 RepID=UPI0011B4F7CF|nr:hypothetical protein [Corynebacterium sp. sy039]QDZ43320.1 hypothetical protein FQV43_09290 [Corynebacterium sp. sy039]